MNTKTYSRVAVNLLQTYSRLTQNLLKTYRRVAVKPTPDLQEIALGLNGPNFYSSLHHMTAFMS